MLKPTSTIFAPGARDLARMDAAIEEWQVVSILINNLEGRYKGFVHRMITSVKELPSFGNVVPVLLEEERLVKRDNKEHAMSASTRNDSQLGGNRNNSKARGRGNNNSDGSSKNPNNPLYKGTGEKPECNKGCLPNKDGTKKRHWPFDCWTLHPEKRSQWSNKGGNPKANKAVKDDFEDSNNTHISAMAFIDSNPVYTSMLAMYSGVSEEHALTDAEFWGEKPEYELGICLDLGEELSDSPIDSPLLTPESTPECSECDSEFSDCEKTEWFGSDNQNLGGDSKASLAESPSNHSEDYLLNDLSDIHDIQILDVLDHESSKRFRSYAANATNVGALTGQSQDWLIDSGCTNHMFFDKEQFIDYHPHTAGVIIANGLTVPALGRGTIEMEWFLKDGSSNLIRLEDVLHVPDLACGLFSISQATGKGLGVSFVNDGCNNTKNKKVVGNAPKVNNSYFLSISVPTAKICMQIQENSRALATSLMFNEEAVELWHRRMGHLNEADLKRLVNMSKGIMLSQKPRVRSICEACTKAKSQRKVSRRVQREVLEKLGKIHVDLGGPFNVPSVDGAKFYMLLTDQATLRTWCFTYKSKDETTKLFREWKTQVENESGCKVKIVRFDNGREFINKELESILKDSGIMIEASVPYTPEQNGLAEVQNRVVMNGVRAMLFDSQLSRFLWTELLHTKVYQKNRSPTARLQGITPHEAWTGEQPYLGHMRIIGSVAWVHIPKEKRKKLDERSKKCYLVGYESSNIFRVWNPATRRVERVSHVDFDESRLMTTTVSGEGYWMAEATGDDVIDDGGDIYDSNLHPVASEPQQSTDSDVVDKSLPNIEGIQNILSQNIPDGERGEVLVENEKVDEIPSEDLEDPLENTPETHSDPSEDATYSPRPRRIPVPSQKQILNEQWSNPSMWAQRTIAHIKCNRTLEAERLYCRLATLSHDDPNYHDFEPHFDLAAAVAQISEARHHQSTSEGDEFDDCEPLTYAQAMASPLAHEWKRAMDKEVNSFTTMGTYKLVPKTSAMYVLSGKWVYKIKKKLDGSIVYKARWVVRGFEQVHGVNYDQTFASVVKSMSYKVLFAIMAYCDLDCEQMDVVTAFLNAPLKDLVYVEQPTGYEEGNNLVCQLLRALYGLKQAPREWYHTLRDFLIRLPNARIRPFDLHKRANTPHCECLC